MSLGSLILTMGADLGQYSSGLKTAGNQAKQLDDTIRKAGKDVEKSLLKIGTASSAMGNAIASGASALAGAFVGLAKNAAKLGDEVLDASERVNVGVQALSELRFAAEKSDASFEELQKGLLKLSKSAGAALEDPLSRTAIAFGKLGISAQELRASSPDQLLSLVADGANRLTDPLDRVGALTGVLSKSMVALNPLLLKGSAGLDEAAVAARRFGQSVTQEAADGSAALGDQINDLSAAATGLSLVITQSFGPSLVAMIQAITGALAGLSTTIGPMISRLRMELGDIAEASDNLLKGAGFSDAINQLRGVEVAGAAISVAAIAASAATNSAAIANKGLARSAEESAAALALSEASLVTDAQRKIDAKEASDKLKTSEQLRSAQASKVASAIAAAAAIEIAALKARTDGLLEAREVQKQFAESTSRAAKSSSAFITSIIDSAQPLNKLTRAYEANVARVKESTDFDARKSAALRVLERDYRREVDAIKRRNEEAAKQPLKQEIIDITALIRARKISIREYEIEAIVQRNLSSIRATSAVDIASETAALRERAGALVDANKQLEQAQAGAPSGISEAFTRAIGNSVDRVDFTTFFRRFSAGLKEAFSKNPGLTTASGILLAGNIAVAFRQGTGEGLRQLSRQLESSENPYIAAAAQTAGLIDTLAGGRLFGTAFAQVSSGINAAFSASGATGSTSANFTRQRSLFGGTARRTDTTAFDASNAAAFTAFFESIRAAVATGATRLGVAIPAIIAGAFSEVKDKDGKITSQISQVGGRIFREGFEDFQRRIQAENLIALVSQSASEATNIAEQWRTSAVKLLDGAQLLLKAQLDIKAGVALISTGGLADIAEFVQRLAKPGEALAAAYDRLASNSAFLRGAIDSISTVAQTATVKFVEFASGLVEALGGLDKAGEIIGRVIAEFFTPAERSAAAAAGRARRLADAQVNFNRLLGADAVIPLPILITRALAGAFSPEAAAAVLAYADAVAATRIATREAAREAAQQADELAASERAVADARRESLEGLDALLISIQAQLQDFTGSEFSRSQRGITSAFAATVASIDEFSVALGGTVDVTRGYAAAQALANAQLADLQRTTRGSILRGLISLYADAARLGPETQDPTQGVGLNNRGPQNQASAQVDKWRESLERLERESATLTIARNIRDLFKSLGKDTLTGLSELGVPVSQFLRDLGLDLTQMTDSTAARFGSIARELGLTLEQLATLSGFDLSNLSPEQRTLAEAAIAQKDAVEKQQADISEIRKTAENAETARFEQAAAQLLTMQDLVLLTSQMLERLGVLTAQNAALSDSLARAQTRAAVGV